MRTKFEEQLERLHVELIQMGALCEDAISAAAEALLKQDQFLAEKAKEAEREIDQKEREIENLCLKLLLQQQPVARDLREISAALKMISDLERIGDQAADIAELTPYVSLSGETSKLHIGDMARATIHMILPYGAPAAYPVMWRTLPRRNCPASGWRGRRRRFPSWRRCCRSLRERHL